ncbi:hypothetical protein EJ06DRAFT_47709 [Trichodelitschia bisporula]|uniref:RING-type domain-containing protein n=1 Tax=Trichodelitschia bisporula TaxID=703511 RepID=A0A6G1HVN7_9PEZI|nr:hypothetical protein EJ06DRAFT_47709 [Trichodelitschia bisporula]
MENQQRGRWPDDLRNPTTSDFAALSRRHMMLDNTDRDLSDQLPLEHFDDFSAHTPWIGSGLDERHRSPLHAHGTPLSYDMLSMPNMSGVPPQTHMPPAPLPLRAANYSSPPLNPNPSRRCANRKNQPPPQPAHRRQPIEGDCPVCWEPYEPEKNEILYCQTTCGHNFHKSCLIEWFTGPHSSNTSNTDKCPMCRSLWDEDQLMWLTCDNGAAGSRASKRPRVSRPRPHIPTRMGRFPHQNARTLTQIRAARAEENRRNLQYSNFGMPPTPVFWQQVQQVEQTEIQQERQQEQQQQQQQVREIPAPFILMAQPHATAHYQIGLAPPFAHMWGPNGFPQLQPAPSSQQSAGPQQWAPGPASSFSDGRYPGEYVPVPPVPSATMSVDVTVSFGPRSSETNIPTDVGAQARQHAQYQVQTQAQTQVQTQTQHQPQPQQQAQRREPATQTVSSDQRPAVQPVEPSVYTPVPVSGHWWSSSVYGASPSEALPHLPSVSGMEAWRHWGPPPSNPDVFHHQPHRMPPGSPFTYQPHMSLPPPYRVPTSPPHTSLQPSPYRHTPVHFPPVNLPSYSFAFRSDLVPSNPNPLANAAPRPEGNGN